MSKKYLNLLQELGFDGIMHDVYLALISQGRGTIKNLQDSDDLVRKYSYSQIYHALNKLHKIHFIEEQQGEEKSFFAVSPVRVFESIREKKLEQINNTTHYLEDIFKRTTTDLGVCTIQINRFHFSSLEMGFQIIEEKFLQNAKKELIFLAPPPILLKRFKTVLIHAYNKGIPISIHFSEFDFEELGSYLKEIQPYVEKANVQINRRQYRVHDACAVNDQYTRIAQLLIDGVSFISFPYYRSSVKNGKVSYNIDFMEGFTNSPSIIAGILQSLILNPILETWVSIPPKEVEVCEIIKQKGRIQKSELARLLGLSGTSLKKILDRLEKRQEIRIDREEKEKGRPMEWVYLLEKE